MRKAKPSLLVLGIMAVALLADAATAKERLRLPLRTSLQAKGGAGPVKVTGDPKPNGKGTRFAKGQFLTVTLDRPIEKEGWVRLNSRPDWKPGGEHTFFGVLLDRDNLMYLRYRSQAKRQYLYIYCKAKGRGAACGKKMSWRPGSPRTVTACWKQEGAETKLKLYVNGRLASRAALAGKLPPFRTFVIGRHAPIPQVWPAEAVLSDVRIGDKWSDVEQALHPADAWYRKASADIDVHNVKPRAPTGKAVNFAEHKPFFALGARTREEYLKKTEPLIRRSLAVLDRHGLDITPTPKMIEVAKGRFDLVRRGRAMAAVVTPDRPSPRERVAVEDVVAGVKALSGVALPVKRASEITERELGASNLILVAGESPHPLVARLRRTAPKAFGEQAYVIEFPRPNLCILSGADNHGALWAAVTFRNLLRKNAAGVNAARATVKDWPDIKNRSFAGLEAQFRQRFYYGEKTKGAEDGRRRAEWVFRLKGNMLRGASRGYAYSSAGDPRFRTPEQIAWYRAVADHADRCGVRLYEGATWSVGATIFDGDKDAYAECVNHRGGLFCWGRDDLIDNRARASLFMAQRAGFGGFTFHAIDTGGRSGNYEMWRQRCSHCRKRFGDDRAAADAHFIGRLSSALSAYDPGFLKLFIVYPYSVRYMEMDPSVTKWAESLSRKLPQDVFLCQRENTRANTERWRRAFKRFLYVYHQPAYTGTHGAFLTSFRHAQTFFFGGPDVYEVTCFWSFYDLMNAGSAEYSWNVAAPCHEDFAIETCIRDSREPREIFRLYLPRWCRVVFGKEAGPHMEKVYDSGFNWRFLDHHEKTVRVLELSDAQLLTEARWQAKAAARAVEGLETILRERVPLKPGRMRDVYQNYQWALYAKLGCPVFADLLTAKMRLAEGRKAEAKAAYLRAARALSEARETYVKALEPLEGKRCIYGPIRAPKAEGLYTTLWVLASSLKSRVGAQDEPEAELRLGRLRHKSGPIKAAVYDARPKGGIAFGADAVLRTLQEAPGITAAPISDLKPSTLARFDCLFVPDTKRFARGDLPRARKALRRFVRSQGGGVYFCHDSVGFRRFPLRDSVFPEVNAKAGDRAVNNTLRVVSDHPLVGGRKLGSTCKHMYFDHITMTPGPEGEVVFVDPSNAPVVIRGQVGAGRVVFDGSIVYMRDDKRNKEFEAKTATGVNRDLLVNAARWLAGKTEGDVSLAVCNLRRKNEVLPDGTTTVLRFRLVCVTKSPLRGARLNVRALDAAGKEALNKDLPKIPAVIRQSFKRDYVLPLDREVHGALRLTVTLSSRESKRTRSVLIPAPTPTPKRGK